MKNIFSKITPNLIFIGLIILVSVSIWTFAFSQKELKTFKNAVTVTGVSTKDVVSDQAVWRISISQKSLDRAQNIKNLTTDEKIVKDYILTLGFNAENISEAQITVDTWYKPLTNGYGNSNEVDNYETKSNFSVTSNDVYKVQSAVNQLRLFSEEKNISLIIDEAEYTYSAFESEKIPLLKQAIADAQNRADALVAATQGVSKTKIGKILSAQQGVFQVNSKNDNSVSDYGNFDLSSIEKTIRATVLVDFNAE